MRSLVPHSYRMRTKVNVCLCPHPPPKCSIVVYSCSLILMLFFRRSHTRAVWFALKCRCGRRQPRTNTPSELRLCMSVDGFAYIWEYFLSTSYAHHSSFFVRFPAAVSREKTPFYFIHLVLFRSPAVICRVVLVACVCVCCRRFFHLIYVI